MQEVKPATSPTAYHFVMAVLDLIDRHKMHDGPGKASIHAVEQCLVAAMMEAWKVTKADTADHKLQVFRSLHAGKLNIPLGKTTLTTSSRIWQIRNW